MTGGVLALCLMLPHASAAAQEDPGGSAVHVVRGGDTLWDLARRYLNDPYRWPEIFAANRGVVQDPDLIHPDARLLIPGRPGTPIAPMQAFPELDALPSRTVFHPVSSTSPGSPSIRLAAQEELPVVPAGTFHRAGLLVPDTEISPLGELVEVISPTVVPRDGAPQIQPYDRVFLRLTGEVTEGQRLQFLRPQRLVPRHGRIYVSTGSGIVESTSLGVATVEIDKLYAEVRIGDVAVAMPDYAPRFGVTPEPASGLEGTLLGFTEPHPVIAIEEIGFVDLGRASGVVEGDELVAYIPPSVAKWGVRPAIDVARLQVVRVGPLTSAVRVVALEQPALEAGLPVRLVAKMPE